MFYHNDNILTVFGERNNFQNFSKTRENLKTKKCVRFMWKAQNRNNSVNNYWKTYTKLTSLVHSSLLTEVEWILKSQLLIFYKTRADPEVAIGWGTYPHQMGIFKKWCELRQF